MKPALIYYVAASLDGYIARPDGQGDWLESIQAARNDHGYNSFYDGIDALLMGRGTFNTLLALDGDWPYPGKPCMVLTRNPEEQLPVDVVMRHCTPAEGLAELAEQGCKRVWLVGGGSLAGNCFAAGLLDELVVSLVPYLLGAGIPLLSTGLERPLKLLEQRSFANGVVQLHYQVLQESQQDAA
ncbi:dihydrofolate reductase family protein [Aquipseudomonas ullengensis]|uniref:Dihydrofolate reductase n=1 Tax=Aquipseudomonas ullengensis TaxID=2759166 RepID=A0A7W4QB64_9GAMM|nr:dihydrofolate reductase family protein [Pseudomonas ullengensis]MBB2496592.1 dihydrofolate reductase [Pseudomonas ullengensis]